MTYSLHAFVLQKLVKFGLVGISGMVVDFLTTWICKEKLLLNKYLANSGGFLFAVCSNFYLNYTWTFASAGNLPTQMGMFFLIAFAGLLLNNLLLYFLADLFHINFYIAKAMAIFGVFFWNFFINYLFNFRS